MAYDEALADRLRDLLVDEPGVSEKKMFGGLGFMVDGHMAVAAMGKGGLMVRPDPESEQRLLEREGVGPMEMRGRPMTGWLLVPAPFDLDDEVLAEMVEISVAHVRTLPPKR